MAKGVKIINLLKLGENMTHLDIWSIRMHSQLDSIDTLMNSIDYQITLKLIAPYNIVKEDAENFCIELAVAGFGKKDIEITKEKTLLTIEGKIDEDSKDFVHKGLGL